MITNSSGFTVASIDNNGDMFLKGNAFQSQTNLAPNNNSFTIINSTNDFICYINNTGSIILRGIIEQTANLSNNLSSGNLEIRNSSNDLVAFFNNSGSLKLQGILAQSYDNSP